MVLAVTSPWQSCVMPQFPHPNLHPHPAWVIFNQEVKPREHGTCVCAGMSQSHGSDGGSASYANDMHMRCR